MQLFQILYINLNPESDPLAASKNYKMTKPHAMPLPVSHQCGDQDWI